MTNSTMQALTAVLILLLPVLSVLASGVPRVGADGESSFRNFVLACAQSSFGIFHASNKIASLGDPLDECPGGSFGNFQSAPLKGRGGFVPYFSFVFSPVVPEDVSRLDSS